MESHTRDLSYTVGASARESGTPHRGRLSLGRDNHHQAEVDDLFAQWESDPLQLLSFPDLGM